MNKLLNAIAAILVARARARAEAMMRKQAAVATRYREVYSANAGGWN